MEREVAERFGVSRLPVREAIRILTAEGFLTTESARRIVVRRLTRTDVDELFELREALEGYIAGLAAERATPQGLEALRALLDEARLHQEIVLAADRLDVTEEIVRLRSHVQQFRRIVEEGGSGKPVGRRLDFLLQEFGREANTIGSKGCDAPIAYEIVELKTEIERLREQVQNVE